MLLSGDPPRSRLLAVMLVAIALGLLVAPFAFPGAQALSVAAKILVFILLVASYDLLLGYTGIASFAHTMFFGIGAYGVAIACTRLGPTWGALALGLAAALAVSLVVSVVIGLASLRVRAMFYAMITLAVAAAFQTLAMQASELTGAEDGLNFKLPEVLSPGFVLFDTPVLGLQLNGRVLCYYLVFLATLLLFLALHRIVNSPFGRVLQAIRENDARAEAMGYGVLAYRALSNVLAALFATLAGALLAIWLRYNGPATTMSFEVMVDVLLMVVIGGMGTMYGAVIGATLVILAQSYLQSLLAMVPGSATSLPLLSSLLSADRWLLWLGVLFILAVYFFPNGIVGRLRGRQGSARVTGAK
jgi:branched-chain amino acid transport system permease protein